MAVVVAIALILWILPSLWWRLPQLTLVDMFLLGFVMFFGAYIVVDAALHPYEYMDELAIVVLFLPIIVTLLMLWVFARRPSRLLRATSLARFRDDWVATPTWAVVGLIAIGLLYTWSAAAFFGEYFTLEAHKLPELERNMPYWLTSIGILTNLTAFPGALCAWGKARSSRGLAKVFWYAMLGVSAVVILGMGRRAVFALLVVVGWDIVSALRAKGRQAAAITMLVLSLPALVAISNVYQAYRLVSWRGVPLSNMVVGSDGHSLIETAAELNRTVENLQDRSATWRFNYEVVKAHLDEKGELQLGRLFLFGIQNLVPSALYSGKETFDTEGELLRSFQLEDYDRAENIFVATYGDFGMFNVVVAPVLVLLFVVVCALVLRWLTDPFLRVLLLGSAIFYAINVEAAYHVPAGLARDFVVIALTYIAIRAFLRSVRRMVQAQIPTLRGDLASDDARIRAH